jgi:hypothetical protein
MRWSIPMVLGVVALGAAGEVRADRVLFQNGDVLTGRVVSLVKGKLKLASDVAGELELDADRIATLSTDGPVAIHGGDGSVTIDRVQDDFDGAVRTAGSGGIDEQTFFLVDVEINPPEPKRWSGILSAGADLKRGNSYKDSGRIDFSVAHRRGPHRVGLKGLYDGDRVENVQTGVGTTNRRKLNGQLEYDYFVTERLFGFARSFLERDGPAKLDLRFIGSLGSGYDWIKTETRVVTGRFGLAWVSEEYSGSSKSDDEYAALLLSYNVEQRLWDAPRLRLFNTTDWVPSLEDFFEKQYLRSVLGLRSSLTDKVFLELKLIWEFNSEPAEDTDRSDLQYLFALGYEF